MIKKIAIIGAGIAGLTLAIGLRRKGFDIQVFEKVKHFEPVGGDIGLWPNGLQVLDHLGLYESISAIGGRYSSLKIGNESDHLIAEIPIDYYRQIAPYDLTNICRYEFQDILVNAFGEKNIVFNKRCVGLQESSKQITAHFQDGSSIAADLLIGTDGADSFVRNYVDQDVKQIYGGYISLGGINTQPYQIKYNWIFGKYFSGAFPVNDNRHLFFFNTAHEDYPLEKKYPNFSTQFDLFKNHSPLLDEMLEKLEKSIRLNSGQNYFFVKNYDLLPLKSWSKGRVVLVGDAAHRVGPILGCATSVILDSIDVLIGCLTKNGNDYPTAFKSYEMIHKPRANHLLQFERQFANAFINGSMMHYNDFNKNLVEVLSNKNCNLMVNA